MKRIFDDVDEAQLAAFAAQFATSISGGEIVSLKGDVGAGKTTFTRTLAHEMGVEGAIQSPTFTIANHYQTSAGLHLAHYDFYRLDDPGIMADELAETIQDPKAVIVIEWGESVADIIPEDHLRIEFVPQSELSRQLTMIAGGPRSSALLEVIA